MRFGARSAGTAARDLATESDWVMLPLWLRGPRSFVNPHALTAPHPRIGARALGSMRAPSHARSTVGVAETAIAGRHSRIGTLRRPPWVSARRPRVVAETDPSAFIGRRSALVCWSASVGVRLFACVCWRASAAACQPAESLDGITQCADSVRSLSAVTQCGHSVRSLSAVTQCGHSVLSLSAVTRCCHSVQSLGAVNGRGQWARSMGACPCERAAGRALSARRSLSALRARDWLECAARNPRLCRPRARAD